jgi:hypothetical protein
MAVGRMVKLRKLKRKVFFNLFNRYFSLIPFSFGKYIYIYIYIYIFLSSIKIYVWIQILK